MTPTPSTVFSTAPGLRRWMAVLGLLLLFGCSSTGPAQDAPPASTDAERRYEMAATYSDERAGDAVVVWREGEVVFEQYQNAYDADQPHILASGTKTLVGLMALAAVDDGLIDLDAPVADHLPEWRDDPQKARITVRQLLHLVGGLPGEIGRAPSFDEAVAADLVHAPGEGFRYGPLAFQVFGALMESVLDGRSAVDYLQERVLDPIGATIAFGARPGDPNLGGGASMTARDWLRVGQLIVQDGQWEGETVVPAGLIAELSRPLPVAPAYGLTVWLNAPDVDPDGDFAAQAPPSLYVDGPGGAIYDGGPPDLFMAAGLFNQRLYLVPSMNLAVVRLGRADRQWNDAEFLARLLDGRAYEAPAKATSRDLEAAVERGTEMRMNRLDAALDLDSAQIEALRPVVEQQVRGFLKLRQERERLAPLSRRDKRRLARQARRLMHATNPAIEAELTEAQVEAYENLRRDRG